MFTDGKSVEYFAVFWKVVSASTDRELVFLLHIHSAIDISSDHTSSYRTCAAMSRQVCVHDRFTVLWFGVAVGVFVWLFNRQTNIALWIVCIRCCIYICTSCGLRCISSAAQSHIRRCNGRTHDHTDDHIRRSSADFNIASRPASFCRRASLHWRREFFCLRRLIAVQRRYSVVKCFFFVQKLWHCLFGLAGTKCIIRKSFDWVAHQRMCDRLLQWESS